MVKIKIPDGDTIFFASTHLGLSKATRLLQAGKLTDIITPLSKPLILAGDLNARPESETIQLLDKIMTRSCKQNCAFTIPVKNPDRKIDYIMYRPAGKFKTIDQEVIHETYASDHLPVVVELRF
jgi:endonuclease/exonuclease/phosphatase family metal-dependent hydrolase